MLRAIILSHYKDKRLNSHLKTTMAMKKTAQEYVYHALDYMRKPTADVALSPIKDEDELETTYGFETSDICKLLNNIENDMDLEVPHTPIHSIKNVTVETVVKYIQSIIDDSNKPSIKDTMFTMGALQSISRMPAEIIASMATLQTFAQELKEEGYEEVEELLLPFMKVLKDFARQVDKTKNKELLISIRAEKFQDKLETNIKRLSDVYAKLIEDGN